jgi:SAM-dependent methyltransferase
VPSRESLSGYYTRKAPEYIGKYLVNGRVHVHVGVYDRERHPELFRVGWLKPSLGEERLKSLMHVGQERTVSRLLRLAGQRIEAQRILDCGAGLGGAAFQIADRYGTSVDALTIVPVQAEFIRDRAKILDLAGPVRAIVGDIFDVSAWWDGAPYDLIIGFDAFSQMGRHGDLFEELRSLQSSGGVLAFSDHYAVDRANGIARYYNDYWVSDISTLPDTLLALTGSGYRIRRVVDMSDEQIPYWEISIAYSQLSTPDRPENRRYETADFHRAMRDAYRDGTMQYYQIVASKP